MQNQKLVPGVKIPARAKWLRPIRVIDKGDMELERQDYEAEVGNLPIARSLRAGRY